MSRTKTFRVTEPVGEWILVQQYTRKLWTEAVNSGRYNKGEPVTMVSAEEHEKLKETIGGEALKKSPPLTNNTYTACGYLDRFTNSTWANSHRSYYTNETHFTAAEVIPVVFSHGCDDMLGTRVIGMAVLEKDSSGIWCELRMQQRSEVEMVIKELIDLNLFGLSHGSLKTTTEDGLNGMRWTKSCEIGECSITPAPSNFFTQLRLIEAYEYRGRF